MTLLLTAYDALTRFTEPMMAKRAGRDLPADRQREPQGVATLPPAPGCVWISAASVGETRAALPVAAALDQVLLTTQTPTAAALVPPEVLHQFTPIDGPQAVERFLNTWQPKLAIFIESELPPRMIRALTARGIPFAIIGARASKTRARAPKTAAKLLAHSALITTATQTIANDMVQMGCHVTAVEDLKAGIATPHPDLDRLNQWRAALGDRPVWLAASTHHGEDELVLAAHTEILRTHPDALLCLAPRHPKRFAQVAELAPNATHQTRTKPTDQTHVHLIDTMGDLPLFYSLAHATFLGGSLVKKGGHSPYEPAAFGSHVFTGPHITNHSGAFDAVPHGVITAGTLSSQIRASFDAPRPEPLKPMPANKTIDALHQLL